MSIMLETFHIKGHLISHLPSYSSFLNPKEEVFSRRKGNVKSCSPESKSEEYLSKFENLIKRSRNDLSTNKQPKDAASQILEADRQCNMSGYFRHMRRFTEIRFRREDL
ncbi:hypothetical protein RF11_06631 [Thelohanellus kitauei]|uniref:Tc1-like transposase DDE domain-containing protein n=1 Tax=Thelohanellus kitauei TaxID=669202 RepID=A0A0C2MK21_THEKT|nr:hypothetical protein RF11_06631 [Thelohanellus kitauei]